MNWFIYTIVFALGLIIGSFINCIIYRLHLKKSFLRGRSFCLHCEKKIYWYDNIPLLSYLLLRAKCRFCQRKISIQYPLVELISAVLFLIVFIATVGPLNNISQILSLSVYESLLLLRNWIFTAILIIIFIYDLKYYLILDKLTVPAMLAALILNLAIQFSATASLSAKYLFSLVMAAVLAGGFFLIQFLISRGKWIGGGDIRLGVLMGLMLGWPNTLAALVISYVLGAIIAILLVIFKNKTLKSQVPLGTFLAIGTFIILLWGQKILDWYLTFTFYVPVY